MTDASPLVFIAALAGVALTCLLSSRLRFAVLRSLDFLADL